jgi:small neutral amino acid transporter SnatA (MarC family)
VGEVAAKAAVQLLFVIVDPISAVPVFLAMTPGDAPAERIRIAGLACCVMAGMLIGFSLLGSWLFHCCWRIQSQRPLCYPILSAVFDASRL